MTARNNKEQGTAPLEGQTEVEGVEPEAPAEAETETETKTEAPAKVKSQVILYSKGDVAELVGMSTQALANRAGRGDGFPEPTYSNASQTVQLYTKEDVKAIHEFLTKPERERLARLNAAMKALK